MIAPDYLSILTDGHLLVYAVLLIPRNNEFRRAIAHSKMESPLRVRRLQRSKVIERAAKFRVDSIKTIGTTAPVHFLTKPSPSRRLTESLQIDLGILRFVSRRCLERFCKLRRPVRDLSKRRRWMEVIYGGTFHNFSTASR